MKKPKGWKPPEKVRRLTMQEAYNRMSLRTARAGDGSSVLVLQCGMCNGEEPTTPARVMLAIKAMFRSNPETRLSTSPPLQMVCSHCTARMLRRAAPVDGEDD